MPMYQRKRVFLEVSRKACLTQPAVSCSFSSQGVLSIDQLYMHAGYWMWRGHRIRYHRCGDCGPPVVLVHGFGGNW